MKKFKLFLLCFVLFISGFNIQVLADETGYAHNFETIFYQKVYPINAINPTTANNAAASYFPGLRGANQMVIYTPTYGLRTNTNEFGGEAIVEGNVVTALSGADSIIPCNGLVISGHGNAKKWMNENIMVGSKIYVDSTTKTLTVYTTSNTYLYAAKERIKEVKNIISYYKIKNYNYNSKKACDYLDDAENFLRKAERGDVQKYSSLAIKAANKAFAHAIPYDKDELKGVWIRPTETSSSEIISTLDRIKNAGINNIFLETYFHGQTIFPSKTMASYGFVGQNPIFNGIDPLRIWINEAHKRDIKVNIWFETFYIGNKNPKNNSKNILSVNPTWGNKTKRYYNSTSPVPSLSEHGGFFIDPANPEVQQYLEDLLTEIIDKYKPDGINLDYIRYPQSMSAKNAGHDLSNWGYTDYARNEFKSRYGIDPIDIQPNTSMWDTWSKYRQDQITTFVQRISQLTKDNGLNLTTVIFPDRNKALETKQQDWRSWSTMGYVDGFTPLLLTCDAKTANVMMQDVMRNKREQTKLYAGLFITFMGGANEDLLRQIQESRKNSTGGVIIFDYAHLNDTYLETLTASAFDAGIASKSQRCQTQSSKQKCKKRLFKRKQHCTGY